MNRPLVIGGGLLALYYLWSKEREIEPSAARNASVYSGKNKQPSIAGFHPAGATFSVWADPTDNSKARGIKIAPIGKKQKYVRITGGPPYTSGYDEKDRVVPFRLAPDRSVLMYAKGAILEMLKIRTPFPSEEQAIGGGADPSLPLVITQGNLQGVPSELAVYEFEWDGPDPR